jgi:hypothetical protein
MIEVDIAAGKLTGPIGPHFAMVMASAGKRLKYGPGSRRDVRF